MFRVVTLASAGDHDAQAELVRRYRKRVTGYLRLFVRDRESLKDLNQMVAIKLVRRIRFLHNPARFESWLFRLARNSALDHLRRTRCRPAAVPYDPGCHDRPDAAADERCHEVHEALNVALRTCDPKNRRILYHAIAGCGYAEIARRERLGIGAVKIRLHRLRLELRMSLRGLIGEAAPAALPRRRQTLC